MEQIKINLVNLSEGLDSDIATVLDVASEIEAAGGDSPEWREILTKFEIGALPPEVKSKEVVRLKASRGAVIVEVASVCDKIISVARHELMEIKKRTRLFESARGEEFEYELGQVRSECTRLEEKIDTLLDRAMSEYKSRVISKQSMFGAINKRALAKKKEAPAVKQRSGFTLLCGSCGAPRLSDAGYECGFCGLAFGKQ